MALHLCDIYLDHFGAFTHYELHGIGPEITVIYGPNEAGKTTLAKAVEGVLFGWESKRGKNNSYSPATGERSARLVFKDDETGECITVSRNALGFVVEPEDRRSLFANLDKDAFKRLCMLNSDELRSLAQPEYVLGTLLATESETDLSPTDLKARYDERIKSFSSRAKQVEISIPRLKQQERELAMRLARAQEEQQDYFNTISTITELESQAMQLRSRYSDLQDALIQIQEAQGRVGALWEEYHRFEQSSFHKSEHPSDQDTNKTSRSVASDVRHMQACLNELISLDEAYKRDIRVAHTLVEQLQQNHNSLHISDPGESGPKIPQVNLIFTAGLGCLIGVLLCVLLGRGESFIHLASFACIGLGLGFGLFYGLSKLSPRNRDSTDILLQQERLRLANLTAEYQVFSEDCATRLRAEGFPCDCTTLDLARSYIEDAWRELEAELPESVEELVLNREEQLRLQRQKDILEQIRICLTQAQDIPEDVQVSTIQAKDATYIQYYAQELQVDMQATQQQLQDCISQIAAAKATLARACSNHDFEDCKLELRRTRDDLAYAYEELAVMGFAREILQSAQKQWDQEREPLVWKCWSEVFSDMTQGAWRQVVLSGTGSLVVVGSDGIYRDVHELSLSTTQQLYLALRIALIAVAPRACAGLPILSDDILAHFDDERRRQAAHCLIELGRQRQVIFFTCHKEIAQLMRDMSNSTKNINLYYNKTL